MAVKRTSFSGNRAVIAVAAFSVASVCAAAEPAWPADFDANLAAHIAGVRAAVSTGVSAGQPLDTLRFRSGTNAFGSVTEPFDSRFRTICASDASTLDTTEFHSLTIILR